MKFKGIGIVWDGEKDAPLCTFVDGEFETEDDCAISKLYELGYTDEDGLHGREINIALNKEDAKLDDEKIIEKALRAKAKELGIKSYHLKSIETLTKEIGEKEGV